MDGTLSASDIALMQDNDRDGMGGGAFFWIFALLILVFGGGGFGFGGNRENYATAADVQRATDFAALERQNNEGVAATRAAAYDVTSAVKDGNYTQLGELRDIQAAIATNGFNSQNCCCETNRNIDSVKFDMANYACAIQANDTENTQKILDAISGNRIADMQNQINQLQLQSALCGVVRYPNATTYSAGYPFNGCGCNTGCGC